MAIAGYFVGKVDLLITGRPSRSREGMSDQVRPAFSFEAQPISNRRNMPVNRGMKRTSTTTGPWVANEDGAVALPKARDRLVIASATININATYAREHISSSPISRT